MGRFHRILLEEWGPPLQVPSTALYVPFQVDMVTTIGIDPHEATHTAVAINETETILGELTVPADGSQTETLLDWARNLDGDGRVWVVEAAGGLGCLLSHG